MPSAIVLVVDGLGAKHLGPYGNTWIETAAMNHLAAESLLWERAMATAPRLDESYRTMWQLAPAAADRAAGDGAGGPLPEWLERQKVSSHLFTDEAGVLDHPLAAGFSMHTGLDVDEVHQPAEQWDETQLAQFFAQAIEALDQLPQDGLLWLHSRGLGGAWDAPLEFRELFADEDDPEPGDEAIVPSLRLDRDYDPDDLHRIQCAFAGQVTLFDQCFGPLLTAVRQISERRELLFVVTAPRAFPMGEHRVVGWDEQLLYQESLHVPLLVRPSGVDFEADRLEGLASLADVPALLQSWFSADEPFAPQPPTREYSLHQSQQRRLLRTPCWNLHVPVEEESNANVRPELYLQPDDRNEVNDVADRCEAVVEAGRAVIRAASQDGPEPAEPLPEVLTQRPE